MDALRGAVGGHTIEVCMGSNRYIVLAQYYLLGV